MTDSSLTASDDESMSYRVQTAIKNLLERYAFTGCPDPCTEPDKDALGLPAHALHRSGENLEGPLVLIADAAADAVMPIIRELEADRDKWLAFIERGMETHMQFGVIKPDGTTEILPCADWCYACKLEELARLKSCISSHRVENNHIIDLEPDSDTTAPAETPQHLCPECNTPTDYATFSGGREWNCPGCGADGSYPEDAPSIRAHLLRTKRGYEELRRQMDAEIKNRKHWK